MPLVSVIIPVYKVENYLPACLESVISQTYKNLQIICINDGSPDNCLEILRRYAANDKRIVVIDQENKGLSVARNVGVEHAAGQFCCFLDSDDAYYPDYVSRLLQIQKETDADIVECRISKSQSPTEFLAERKPQYKQYKVVDNPLSTVLTHQKYRIRFMVYTRLYKTELIKNHKFIKGIYFEDYPWSLSLMSKNPKVAITNEILYNYTYNPNSITKSKFTAKKCDDYFTGLQYLYHDFKDKPESMKILRQRIIPRILKSQYKLIIKQKSDDEIMRSFSYQLNWLKEHGLLSVWNVGLRLMYLYHKIMKITSK